MNLREKLKLIGLKTMMENKINKYVAYFHSTPCELGEMLNHEEYNLSSLKADVIELKRKLKYFNQLIADEKRSPDAKSNYTIDKLDKIVKQVKFDMSSAYNNIKKCNKKCKSIYREIDYRNRLFYKRMYSEPTLLKPIKNKVFETKSALKIDLRNVTAEVVRYPLYPQTHSSPASFISPQSPPSPAFIRSLSDGIPDVVCNFKYRIKSVKIYARKRNGKYIRATVRSRITKPLNKLVEEATFANRNTTACSLGLLLFKQFKGVKTLKLELSKNKIALHILYPNYKESVIIDYKTPIKPACFSLEELARITIDTMVKMLS